SNVKSVMLPDALKWKCGTGTRFHALLLLRSLAVTDP
ncbi:hypothetical protein Tco_0193297, partial [Tanacetum coccineum]